MVGTLGMVSDDETDRHDEGDDVEPLIPIDSDAEMMATARRRYGAVGAIVAGLYGRALAKRLDQNGEPK